MHIVVVAAVLLMWKFAFAHKVQSHLTGIEKKKSVFNQKSQKLDGQKFMGKFPGFRRSDAVLLKSKVYAIFKRNFSYKWMRGQSGRKTSLETSNENITIQRYFLSLWKLRRCEHYCYCCLDGRITNSSSKCGSNSSKFQFFPPFEWSHQN